MLDMDEFARLGWAKIGFSPAQEAWAKEARKLALTAVQDPAHAQWLQCSGTWFVGVDVLANDAQGRVNDVPLSAEVKSAMEAAWPKEMTLHKAQVSVIYPGYPKPRDGESDAAFGYRKNRDAAHVDGLRLNRATSARCCAEYHAYVLGLPLTEASPDASPMVLWEGSHSIMQQALLEALAPYPPARWSEIDISAPYKAARRAVFETCPRIELSAAPGEAYILHRHLLHGVAPWGAGASAAPEGRMIAYFRPDIPEGVGAWANDDAPSA